MQLLCIYRIDKIIRFTKIENQNRKSKGRKEKIEKKTIREEKSSCMFKKQLEKYLSLNKYVFVELILEKFIFIKIIYCRSNNLELLSKLWFEDKTMLIHRLSNMLYIYIYFALKLY